MLTKDEVIDKGVCSAPRPHLDHNLVQPKNFESDSHAVLAEVSDVFSPVQSPYYSAYDE